MSQTNDTTNTTVSLSQMRDDIFECPPGSVIVHSCNCIGVWGRGFAKTLADLYPEQYDEYRDHCKSANQKTRAQSFKPQLRGTALLCEPPASKDRRNHAVGCLFVKAKPGPTPSYGDNRQQILAHTKTSFEDLLLQVAKHAGQHSGSKMPELHLPKINSGLFNVPWEMTKKTILTLELPEGTHKDDWKIFVHEH